MLYIIIHRTFCHNTSIFKPIKLTSPIGCRYSKFWFFTQLTINIPNNANKNFLFRFGCMCSFLTRTVQLPLKFISRLIKKRILFLLHVSLTSRPQKYSIWFISKSNTLNSLNIEPSFFFCNSQQRK